MTVNGDRVEYERKRDRALVTTGIVGLFLLLAVGVVFPELGGQPLMLALVTAFSSLLVAPIILPRKNGK